MSLLVLLVGLGLLGYGAWQYWGTNMVAKKEHARIIDQWDAGEGDAIGILRVPRFGRDFKVPIIPGGDLLGDDGKNALSRGVAWYEKGARPGEIGNFVIAGHRVTHGEPFRKFLDLRTGDRVIVETREATFTYQLRNDGDAITITFREGWPLRPVPTPDDRVPQVPESAVLTMLTCSELFHTDNRQVVIGDLVDTQPRPGAS